MVAAEVCNCSLQEAHAAQQFAAGEGEKPAGIDVAFIILVIETLLPVIIQILEECPEPEPERRAHRAARMGWGRRLVQRRRVMLMLRDDGMSRNDAREVARETVRQMAQQSEDSLTRVASDAASLA